MEPQFRTPPPPDYSGIWSEIRHDDQVEFTYKIQVKGTPLGVLIERKCSSSKGDEQVETWWPGHSSAVSNDQLLQDFLSCYERVLSDIRTSRGIPEEDNSL